MQITNKLHPYSSFDWHATSVKQFPSSFASLPVPLFLRFACPVYTPPLSSLARQSLAYQSTNCSMSQLYRYLINYKRAIAATPPPTLARRPLLSAPCQLITTRSSISELPLPLLCLSISYLARVRDSQVP